MMRLIYINTHIDTLVYQLSAVLPKAEILNLSAQPLIQGNMVEMVNT